MQTQIDTLIEAIKTDYIKFATRGGTKPLEGYFANQVEKFDDLIEVKYGNKYIKIIKENSVWGFIVNTDNDKKFKKGDILKAAGWNAPSPTPPVTFLKTTVLLGLDPLHQLKYLVLLKGSPLGR